MARTMEKLSQVDRRKRVMELGASLDRGQMFIETSCFPRHFLISLPSPLPYPPSQLKAKVR